MRVLDGLVFYSYSVCAGILEAMRDWDTDFTSFGCDLSGFYDAAGVFCSDS